MSDVSLIDVRGPRFAAWITTLVLAGVLLTHSATLLALQAVVFALGATGRSPYAALWKRIPKSPPTELEDPRPPQFAQWVGLGFAILGVLGFLTWTPLGVIATAAALTAAFLNAAFGFCLGCEIYLIVKRTTQSKTNEGVAA
jgi:hypothetical protein